MRTPKIVSSSPGEAVIVLGGWLVSVYLDPPDADLRWENLKVYPPEDGRRPVEAWREPLPPLAPIEFDEHHAIKKKAIGAMTQARKAKANKEKQRAERARQYDLFSDTDH